MHEAVLKNLGQTNEQIQELMDEIQDLMELNSGAYGHWTRFRILWEKTTYRGVLANCPKIN